MGVLLPSVVASCCLDRRAQAKRDVVAGRAAARTHRARSARRRASGRWEQGAGWFSRGRDGAGRGEAGRELAVRAEDGADGWRRETDLKVERRGVGAREMEREARDGG